MTQPDIEQLAKECAELIMRSCIRNYAIATVNFLQISISRTLSRAIAPLRQELEKWKLAHFAATEANKLAESELAELRKDKERLDWLNSKADKLFAGRLYVAESETLREAIDAAMKGNP